MPLTNKRHSHTPSIGAARLLVNHCCHKSHGRAFNRCMRISFLMRTHSVMTHFMSSSGQHSTCIIEPMKPSTDRWQINDDADGISSPTPTPSNRHVISRVPLTPKGHHLHPVMYRQNLVLSDPKSFWRSLQRLLSYVWHCFNLDFQHHDLVISWPCEKFEFVLHVRSQSVLKWKFDVYWI